MEITADNFDKEVLEAESLVVLDFWASWCGPCRMQAPVFEEAAAEVTDVVFGKVNVDEQTELAQQFGVMSIPTLVFMKKKEVLAQVVGFQSKQELLAKVEELK